jgi:glucose-1-phosphate thymidylyltransferase
MKGILLAGGAGTRLWPMTAVVSKQLLPVYDKPLLHYPLTTLMLAGVRDVLVIGMPDDLPRFEALLGDGTRLGMAFTYAPQPRPEGIAQALLLARDWLAGASTALALGDNIFHGSGLTGLLRDAVAANAGATIFGTHVTDPERYGVATVDGAGRVIALEEKPAAPASPIAVTGLYLYDGEASDRAATLRPSSRGELEITDLNRSYLADGRLALRELPRGMTWLDTGTPESLLAAAEYVALIERRQGRKVASPEEVAWRLGWIDDAALDALAAQAPAEAWRRYWRGLLTGGRR